MLQTYAQGVCGSLVHYSKTQQPVVFGEENGQVNCIVVTGPQNSQKEENGPHVKWDFSVTEGKKGWKDFYPGISEECQKDSIAGSKRNQAATYRWAGCVLHEGGKVTHLREHCSLQRHYQFCIFILTIFQETLGKDTALINSARQFSDI